MNARPRRSYATAPWQILFDTNQSRQNRQCAAFFRRPNLRKDVRKTFTV
jgi:hypothetical protein